MALSLRLLDDFDRNLCSPFYDFGHALTPAILRQHPAHKMVHYDMPQWSQLARLATGKEDRVSPFGKDGFQVSMDVTQFKPSELTVKVVDNCITVEGKHEEREDHHGHISRHFVRRYTLPKDYDPEKVASTLSSDGVLTVSVPKPQAIEDKAKERIIQIQQTGPAHLSVKAHSPKEEASNGEAESK